MITVYTESGTVYKLENGRVWRDTTASRVDWLGVDLDGLPFKHLSSVEIGMPMRLKVYGMYNDREPGIVNTSPVRQVN